MTIQQYLFNQHCQYHPSAVECQRRHQTSKKGQQGKIHSESDISKFKLTQNFLYFREVLKEQYEIRTGSCIHELIVLVSSRADNYELRKAIRDTWASVRYANIKVMFVTGKLASLPWPLRNSETQLLDEMNRYKDVIVGNFIDDIIYTTTVKYLFGFQWILNNCYRGKFVLCVEDTMFVNLTLTEEVLTSLMKRKIGKVWIGTVRNHQPVSHLNSEIFEWFGSSHRYYVPYRSWPDSTLPPLCVTELGFILSVESVEYIYRWSWNHTLFPRPDVHISIVAGQDNITWDISHNTRITPTLMKGNVCMFRKFVITNGFDNPDLFYKAWNGHQNVYDLQLDCHNPDVDQILPRGVSNHNYFDKTLGLIHDVRHACLNEGIRDNSLTLLMLITSHPNNFEARQAIRRTWASNANIHNSKLLFVLGVHRNLFSTFYSEREIQSRIHKEYVTHQDLIQANFSENHRNLTLKVVLGLRWVTTYCPNARFVFKGDDDVFVNLKQLVTYLSSLNSYQRILLGSVNTGPVVRDDASKYYVEEKVYPAKFYPPFLSGGGYVMSRDLVPKFYQASLTTYLLPLDDVYQGILAKRIGVEPQNHKFFRNAGGSKDVCLLRNSTFTFHRFKPDELMQVWEEFKNRLCNVPN